jgi:hypothetical protein
MNRNPAESSEPTAVIFSPGFRFSWLTGGTDIEDPEPGCAERACG